MAICFHPIDGKSATIWTSADRFFSAYVSEEGYVHYDRISKNQQELQTLRTEIRDIKTDTFARNEQKAFLINAYNILVINSLMKHYPLSSVQDIDGFFDKQSHVVAGEKLTLNALEDTLIQRFQDPRIHFALVCAAQGCPSLLQEAYLPGQVNQQLEEQTRQTLQDDTFIRVNHYTESASISKIFKWYTTDFLEKSSDIKAYINDYRIELIPPAYSINYYTYDWDLNDAGKNRSEQTKKPTTNIVTYIPSVLLEHNQFEIQLFNNLYTQTAYRNSNGKRIPLDRRENYFTGLFRFMYGISPSRRINVGLDVNFRSVLYDPNEANTAFRILTFNNRSAITTIGPKIEIAPFSGIKGLAIQSSFWFPVASNPEGNPWLDYDRYTSWTRILYDITWGNRFQLFTEADLLMRFTKTFDMKETLTETPISVFFSYLPTSNLVLYGMSEYNPTLATPSTYYYQAGAGAKYQLFSNFHIELMYTNFLFSANKGAGETFNIGFRYIR